MTTYRDYREYALEPPERLVVGTCAYCGDEVYDGEKVYFCDGEMLHPECVLQHIQDHTPLDMIAGKCGYHEGVA